MINYLNNFVFSSNTNNYPPFTLHPCMDQIVGTLTNGIYMPSQRSNIDYQISNGHRFINNIVQDPIVIVLESPHKNEYDASGNAIGPAQSTTGRLFNLKFTSMVSNSTIADAISLDTHDVIMVNAVQYQCSLGNPLNTRANRAIRDQIWLNCLSGGCAQDLIYRIDAIDPMCVINLCTKGVSNLQDTLSPLISGFGIYTYGSHPSTWNFSYACIE